MNSQHRAIRALLQSMAPSRAAAYIQSFGLRPEEEAVLRICDIGGLSCQQAADRLNLSSETVKRRRRQAYGKIADEIEH